MGRLGRIARTEGLGRKERPSGDQEGTESLGPGIKAAGSGVPTPKGRSSPQRDAGGMQSEGAADRGGGRWTEGAAGNQGREDGEMDIWCGQQQGSSSIQAFSALPCSQYTRGPRFAFIPCFGEFHALQERDFRRQCLKP